MSNPYSNCSLEDLQNEELVDNLMGEEVCTYGGDWCWQDSQTYLDMQKEWLDERLQELASRCVTWGCEKRDDGAVCQECCERMDKVFKVGEELGVY